MLLRSHGGNSNYPANWLTIKAPIIAAFIAPRNCWVNCHPVELPVCRHPVLSVVVVYLHCKRHIRVGGEVRRAHRRKLQQFRNVLVRRVPISDKLVIIHKEMNDFAFRVFRRVMVIHGDKLAMRIRLYRLDLRNIVLAKTWKYKLVQIFKVYHGKLLKSPCE